MVKKQIFKIVGPAALVLLAAGGCVENRESLTIVGILPPMGGCEYSPMYNIFRPWGRLDAAISREYIAIFKVENNLESTEGHLGYEANSVSFLTYSVNLTPISIQQGGEPDSIELTVQRIEGQTGGVLIAPGSPGVVALTVLRLTSDDVNNIMENLSTADVSIGDLVFKVKLYGRTTGGDGVETDTFEFPLRICYGCMIDPTNVTIGVDGSISCIDTTKILTSTGCFEGQDDWLYYCSTF